MFYELNRPKPADQEWPEGVGSVEAVRAADRKPISVPVTKQSVLITGTTGFGKTTFVKEYVGQRLDNDENTLAVFLELKPGDFSNEFMEKSSKMIAFSESACPKGSCFKWGMIKEIRQSKDWEAETEALASSLFREHLQDKRNLTWANGAKNTFIGFINTILYCHKNNPSNAQVINAMRYMSPEEFLAHLAKYPPNRSLLRDDFAYDPDHPEGYVMPRKGSDIMFFLQDVLSKFRGTFISDDGEDTIADWLAGKYGSRLFLAYDYSKKDSYGPFARYFLNKIISDRLSFDFDRSKNILLVLDEAAELEQDFGLMQGVTLGRQNGLQVILCTQSFEKLYRIMPDQDKEHMLNATLAGFPTLVAFHPGDPQTMTTLQKLFGNRQNVTVAMPFSRYDKPAVHINTEPIVKDEDFAAMKVGECYIKIREAEPELVRILLHR